MRVYTRNMKAPCYCAALRGATRKISAVYDHELAEAGINIAQFSLLRRIERAAPVSLTEIGRLTGLDRSTVGRNVKVLQRMGFVEPHEADDQREAAWGLSPRGVDLLAGTAQAWQRGQQRIEKKLGKAGVAELQRLLQALSEIEP